MKPCEVKKYGDLMKLKRDNVSYGDAWIIFNSHKELVICNQKVGEKATASVHLTKRQFQRFIDWWQGTLK